jgi:hypothetical protein
MTEKEAERPASCGAGFLWANLKDRSICLDQLCGVVWNRKNRSVPLLMKLLIASALLILSTTSNALSPCDGLENSVTHDVKPAWEIEFAKQLESPKVELVRSFRAKDWYMIYVRPFESDDVYLFFHGDPTHAK